MNTRITNETVRESMHKQIAAQPTWTTRIINSSQLKSKHDYQRKIDMGYVKEKILNRKIESDMALEKYNRMLNKAIKFINFTDIQNNKRRWFYTFLFTKKTQAFTLESSIRRFI